MCKYYSILNTLEYESNGDNNMNIQQMKNEASQILYRMGAQNVFVYLISSKKTVASTIGLTLHQSFLGFNPPIVGGIIYVNDKILSKNFTDNEIRFILAHECAHIFNNHVIASTFWNFLEKSVKGEYNENYEAVEFIKLILTLGSKNKLPPNAVTLRNQEYEADRIAVNITGDLNSAISCLIKLVGNNMSLPSHTWELFGTVVPVMTMGERINVLRSGIVFL